MKAIVFIDVQNDFLKGGKLAFNYPVEDNLQKVVEFAKTCVDDPGCKIYATRDTHEATKWTEKDCAQVVVGYLATLEGQKLPVEHCVEGTEGWQIADQMMDVLLGKTTFINKPTFGSFDLADLVYEDFGKAGPDEIVIAGYDAAICVISNALILRAKFPDAKITIKRELCGCTSKESFDAAMEVAKCCQIDVE